MMTRPPRLASWMLGRALDDRRREELLGDLEELFHFKLNDDGRFAARRWYWRQTADAIIDAIRERRRLPKPPGGDSFMQRLLQDLRYAVRSLVANPGFTGVAILMLALGIGANATIFSWVNAVLLNPLPGATRANELVQLMFLYRGDTMPSFSYPDYQDLTRGSTQLTGITGYEDLAVGIVVDREAERAWAQIVTSNLFDVLGVPVALGRGFTADDEKPGTPAAAVLSDAYWKRRFNGDPGVIGRQIRVNAQPFTIVGVAAPGFLGATTGLSYDMWLPIGTQPTVMPGGNRLDVRGSKWLGLIGRVRPDATHDQVRAELDGILEDLRKTWASQNRYLETRAAVFPLDNTPDGGIAVLRPVLLILTAVAAVVLLITCANLAGLLLARASARQREIAIRLSMGAGRWRIVQQLLVEGMVLSSLGAIAALIALRWTSGLLIGFAPPSELPIHLAVDIDATVVWFTALVAIATVLLFAVAPAAIAAPADVATTLRDSGAAGRGFGRHRLRRALVAAQVALSIALLVGAGLRLRSLGQAAHITPGFQAEGVVVGWVDLFSAGYTATEDAHFTRGSSSACGVYLGLNPPRLAGAFPSDSPAAAFSDLTVEGHQVSDRDPQGVGLNYVGPDYAATLRIPVVAGRDLSADDRFERPRVALRHRIEGRASIWKDRDPIGGRFMFGRPRPDQEPEWLTVVGVVKDIKQRSLTERPQPLVMIPILQFYSSTSVLNVRTASGLTAIDGSLQQAVREVDPRVPFYNVSLLSEHTSSDIPAETRRRSAGRIRSAGVAARRSRQLRRLSIWLACGGGDRYSPGGRCHSRRRVPVDHLHRGPRDRPRSCDRPSVVDWRRYGSREPADRHRADRSHHLRGCDRHLSVVAAAACMIPARRAASLDPAITLAQKT